MKHPENNKWLDDILAETIGAEKSKPDFEKWKENYPEAAEMLTSRAGGEASVSPGPIKIRKIIMKSPITKLVVAACVIIAVIGLWLKEGVTSKVYAMDDVPQLIRQAKTIHIKGWRSGFKVPVKGEESADRHYTQDWYDIQNGLSRTMGFGAVLIMPEEKLLLNKIETVLNGQYKMQINHSSKSVQFYKLSEFTRRLSVRRALDHSLERISLTPEKLAEFRKIGQDKIDDINFDVWEKKASYGEENIEVKSKYWISPTSGKIGRVECCQKGQETAGEWHQISQEEIELDVAPPENIFDIQPPPGYRLSNTKETPYIHRLITQPFGWRDSVQGEIAIVIALPNGIGIIGWYAEDPDSEDSKEESFEDIQVGGELPTMPVEVEFGLWPTYNDESVTYVGRHLACTQKDNKFYEWGIFVPNKEVDASRKLHRSKVLISLHPNIRELVEGEDFYDFYTETVVIKKDEFDTFVRAAMAELSDGAVAPEHVTYDSVLSLADEIRTSIKE